MHISYAVVVATIIYIVIGFVWYSRPVFGEYWMRYMKVAKKDTEKGMAPAVVGGIIIALIQSYFLASLIIEFKAYDAWSGVQIAFWTWLGFIATTQFSSVLWSKTPLQLYFINAGCYLVTYLIIGGVMSAMLR